MHGAPQTCSTTEEDRIENRAGHAERKTRINLLIRVIHMVAILKMGSVSLSGIEFHGSIIDVNL